MSKFFTLTVTFATLAMLAGCSADTDETPSDVSASSQAVRGERDTRGIEAPPPGTTDGRGEGDPSATEGSTVEPSTTPSDDCGEGGRLCPNPAR